MSRINSAFRRNIFAKPLDILRSAVYHTSIIFGTQKTEVKSMCVAEKLKSIVDERGTTYTFLSKRTGIKVDAISKSLSGKRRLPADEMVALCYALNVDLCDLDIGAGRGLGLDTSQPRA